MKKFLLHATAILGLFAFTACDSDDKVTLPEENETPANRCYIVNTGNWEGNDASIQYYSFETDMATAGDSEANIFAVQNKTLLGDLAQDLLWTKEKLFVTVSGSQKIEVLDESGKRLQEPYMFTQEGASPRMLTTDGVNVYATNYDGNVYVYNATTAAFEGKIPVGTRPEGISYCNDYLVVNNSGDLYAYNGTVSIIDLQSGDTRTINMVNPYTASVVCNDEVYIIDSGNYYDIPSSVYCISPEEGTATSLGFSASAIASYENILYYVDNSWDYEKNAFVTSPLFALDVTTGEKREVLTKETMTDVNSLSVNPENGDIYVGYATYGVLGNMRIFDSTGKQKSFFGVGYYTAGARFRM